MLVFILTLLIWFGGALTKVSRGTRYAVILFICALFIVGNLLLSQDHVLRAWITGQATMAAFAIALVIGYLMMFSRLRARAPKQEEIKVDPKSFAEEELDRYARHIVLREIGGLGQKRLKNARVLVIGAGGLGSPALMYLAASGVGTIGIIDDDIVDKSNLQRQIIHDTPLVGEDKVRSAMQRIAAINPHVEVRPYKRRLDAEIASDLFSDYDLVLDGTDNFETRYLVNATCVSLGKPLVSGALSQWEGQLTVFDPAHGGPCYQCVFPEAPAAGLAPSCAEAGVFAPLPGVIGTMMAAEAVKVITQAGDPLVGRMTIYDALYADHRTINLSPRSECPTCGHISRS